MVKSVSLEFDFLEPLGTVVLDVMVVRFPITLPPSGSSAEEQPASGVMRLTANRDIENGQRAASNSREAEQKQRHRNKKGYRVMEISALNPLGFEWWWVDSELLQERRARSAEAGIKKYAEQDKSVVCVYSFEYPFWRPHSDTWTQTSFID